MIRLVLRRMSSNLWMIVCLLLGTILATSLVCSIPLYTDGIMQRMLTKDLENYQVEKGGFPGAFTVKSVLNYAYEGPERPNALRYFRNRVWGVMGESFDTPILDRVEEIRVSHSTILSEPPDPERPDGFFAELAYRSDLPKHVAITNGRMYADQPVDGIVEVVVSPRTFKDMNLLLDREYEVVSKLVDDYQTTRVRVVGVVDPSDPADPYWNRKLAEGAPALYMSEQIFLPLYVEEGSPFLREAYWYYALDYHEIEVGQLSHMLQTWDTNSELVQKYRGVLEIEMPAVDIIGTYHERAARLSTTLWVLAVPVLLMLIFYIFMVSQLIVGNDENGIAVLKSRGASKTQIFVSYLVESVLLGLVAMAAGPPVGLLLCRILGASNGFLEFVSRTALPLSMGFKAYAYAGIAFVLIVVTMLIPVVLASRTTIVKVKQGRARSKRVFWRKYFLDIIVLGVAFYGLYQFNRQQSVLEATGISAGELEVDPLLFLASTLFVLGAGLLFLRIYPYLVRLIYWVGRRIWSPVLYISLVQVGRSRGQEQFLMLFIILSISIGLFNANSARTTNQNVEDKTHYSVGSDVLVKPVWKTNEVPSGGAPSGMPDMAQTSSQPAAIKYIEPNFKAISELEGVDLATKVLRVENVRARAYEGDASAVSLMAIHPSEFGQVSWFRSDLLPHHWYAYLNLLTEAPKAALLSTNLMTQLGVEPGDSVNLSWTGSNSIEVTVYAGIDYWPTFNPNPEMDPIQSAKEGTPVLGVKPSLIVANFDYLMNKLPIQPYDVWIRKTPGTPDKVLHDAIDREKIPVVSVTYANQELIKQKNDPMLQGINGSLTLGFVAAMAISLLGFLIYWIISIQQRVLQFGILRAMGLSLSKVIGMIACEQVLVSGAAVAIGFVVGNLASRLYIPLLQISSSAAEQVPPFRIVAQIEDYYKVYAVVAAMLVIGFVALWRIIARIRIDQALKLGED